ATAVEPNDVALPDDVTTPVRFAFVVTVILESVPETEPPTGMEVVATQAGMPPLQASIWPPVPCVVVERRVVPLPYGIAPVWIFAQPVPPFATAAMPVMFPAVPPMFRVEVLIAAMFPVAPVAFPRSVFAAAWASMPTVTLFAPMVVAFPVEGTSPVRFAF